VDTSLFPTIQLVYQPGVDGPERASAFIIGLPDCFYVFVEPQEFDACGVGGERQTAQLWQLICAFALLELADDARGASIGPDDGVI